MLLWLKISNGDRGNYFRRFGNFRLIINNIDSAELAILEKPQKIAGSGINFIDGYTSGARRLRTSRFSLIKNIYERSPTKCLAGIKNT